MNLLLELNSKQKNATCIIMAAVALLAFLLIKDNVKLTLALGVVLALMFKNYTTVYVLYRTLPRDAIAIYRFIKFTIFTTLLERRNWSVARTFQENSRKYPHKPCFLIEDRQMTFQDVENYSNKIATYFKHQGFRKGDCVCLLMENGPEYACMWLGLSKIGVITALLNTNQRKQTLLHSITVSKSKAIIVGTELTKPLIDIVQNEEIKSLRIYQYTEEVDNGVLMQGAIDLTNDLKTQTTENLSIYINDNYPKDKLMYVFTSGTTGLPKAAVITNQRYIFMTTAAYYLLALKSDDIIYDTLPLYHTAGGIVGLGLGVVHGCTIVLRKKFSASNFWKDCIKYNATCAQYIGEICRYLLNTPEKPEDTQHKLRLMYGNGLRPQIWTQFVQRFNIPNIVEVYASTEGNSNLANIFNQVGAIGFIPLGLRIIYPLQIIRVNEETGEPILNEEGFGIRCKAGETGLLLGKVDRRRALTDFEGYVDKNASEKKLLRNVFKNGDVYFNSGDMVIADILGYLYFKDRTGDTYRWRGENVSTQEVEAIVTNLIGLQDCVAYGVEIPYVEGRAGMVAIEDPEKRIDFEQLSLGIRDNLPAYARPIFIRVMNQIPRTATFKMKKRDIMLDGFNINQINDPIYYLNKDGLYHLLNMEQFNNLQNNMAGL